eukprot:3842647-Pleurochrysis_carterae.AAC.4
MEARHTRKRCNKIETMYVHVPQHELFSPIFTALPHCVDTQRQWNCSLRYGKYSPGVAYSSGRSQRKDADRRCAARGNWVQTFCNDTQQGSLYRNAAASCTHVRGLVTQRKVHLQHKSREVQAVKNAKAQTRLQDLGGLQREVRSGLLSQTRCLRR